MSQGHANTLETASSSSGSCLNSFLRADSSSASFRLLYLFPFSRLSIDRTADGDTNSMHVLIRQFVMGIHDYPPGLEYTVAPPNAPSKIRIGVNTKRGPISTNVVCCGSFGCNGSFSIIYLPETRVKKNAYSFPDSG